MNVDYLSRLPLLTEDEREQLRAIGAPTPLSLLSTKNASPAAFERMLGKNRLCSLKSSLEKMISSKEKELLAGIVPEAHPLGANLAPAPGPIGPTEMTEERDRIYRDIQRLKANPVRSSEEKHRL